MGNLKPSSHVAHNAPREVMGGGPRVTVRGRVTIPTKDALLRAVELGIYLTESELVEAAVTRLLREEIEPALLSGNFDKTRQTQRRLDSLALSAQTGPPPGQTAEQLIKGAERQLELDEESAIHYTSEVERELTERNTAWGRRVLLVLNSSPVWLKARGK